VTAASRMTHADALKAPRLLRGAFSAFSSMSS
jgi:hypothetical protein